MLGLASMAEVPAVIIDVQRGGPSTGLPTKSEQSDLWQALWGSHGDAPRVVLAPADVEDCFHATVAAFNIAEEAQMPVIVLSDQFIAQRRETLSMLTLDHEVKSRQVPTAGELEDYRRYRDTVSGISPMTWPGMKGGEYQTNGLEHDEYGQPTSMYLTHEKMNAKRYRKLRSVRANYAFYRRYGSEEADVGILCWGSAKGPVKEAVMRANGRGEKVAAFVPQVLYPFPYHEFQQFLQSVKSVIVVELSYSAQFYKYLHTFLELPKNQTFLFKRSGGKNLTVSEVEERISKVLELAAMRREVLV
jgi:2-oxoglutarate ferredoxin oxidoreductase subunit alpha